MKLSYLVSLSVLLIVPISLSAMEGDANPKSPRDTSKRKHRVKSSVTFNDQTEFGQANNDPIGQDLDSSLNSEEGSTDQTRGFSLFKNNKSKNTAAAAIASAAASESENNAKALQEALNNAQKKIESLEKSASYIKPLIIGSACTLTVIIGFIVYQLLYHSHEENADEDDGDDQYESAQAQVA